MIHRLWVKYDKVPNTTNRQRRVILFFNTVDVSFICQDVQTNTNNQPSCRNTFYKFIDNLFSVIRVLTFCYHLDWWLINITYRTAIYNVTAAGYNQ